MALSEACERCGQTNHGSEPEPTSAGIREVSFQCDGCDAEGVVNTHFRAGIISRTGAYFDADEAATSEEVGC